MSPFNLETCARPNMLALEPYRCARDDYKDDGTNILLDANENAYGPALSVFTANDAAATPSPLPLPFPSSPTLATLHRYPDPHQTRLKQLLCDLRTTAAAAAPPPRLTPAHLFVGVGSDEAIDALLRCFCVPGRDRILVCPPTYGMYAVSAQVNDVALVRVPLRPAPGFGLDADAVADALARDAARAPGEGEGEGRIKMVYLCSPGNPTGALLRREDVRALLEHPTWNGVVVVDEAYVDFAGPGDSLAEWAAAWPNLVVMQTLSKGFGLAGIRLGVVFTSPEIARLLNSLKAPYNVSSLTAAIAEHALSGPGLAAMRENRAKLIAQRERLLRQMPGIPGVGRLRGGTDSNFLLYEMLDKDGKPDNATALAVYERLAETKGVVVRFRGKEHGCLGCLRITVGTEDEVTRFLASLERTLAEVRGTAPAEASAVAG